MPADQPHLFIELVERDFLKNLTEFEAEVAKGPAESNPSSPFHAELMKLDSGRTIKMVKCRHSLVHFLNVAKHVLDPEANPLSEEKLEEQYKAMLKKTEGPGVVADCEKCDSPASDGTKLKKCSSCGVAWYCSYHLSTE
jgi:hypothetical protein